jgi:DNA-binding protein YbaB
MKTYEKQLEQHIEQLQEKLEEAEQHSDFRGDVAEVTVKAFGELDDIVNTVTPYFKEDVTKIVKDTVKKITSIYEDYVND